MKKNLRYINTGSHSHCIFSTRCMILCFVDTQIGYTGIFNMNVYKEGYEEVYTYNINVTIFSS